MAMRQSDQTLWRTMFGSLSILGFVIWRELQRRDETLNHEASRLQAAVTANVSADTYDANERQRRDERTKDEEWRKRVDEKLTQSVGREEFKTEAKRDSREALGALSAGVRAALAVGLALAAFIGYEIAHSHPASVAPAVTQTMTQTVTRTITAP
jgi:hypothetical protein